MAEGKKRELSDVVAEKVGKCRMYEKEFPGKDDLVMVLVTDLNDVGAFVTLLEYNNLEGYILLSELSRRRMRSINKHIRVGKKEILQVLRVDEEKRYIDLSKKNLNQVEIDEALERYRKSTTVHSILEYVAKSQDPAGEEILTFEQVYQQMAWPLYAKYDHAYDAYRKYIKGEDIFAGLTISPHLLPTFHRTIHHRMGLSKVKVVAEIQLTCFKRVGIDGIRQSIVEALESFKKSHNITEDEAQKEMDEMVYVRLESSPVYVVYTTTTNEDIGLEYVREVMASIEANIKGRGGQFNVKSDARVFSNDP